jgi:molybdopterin-dependent oxidoreductase alpha subunit
MKRHVKIEPYRGPVGGWGSARAVSDILLREGRPIEGPITLAEQNKPSGFACVSCSYAKPGQPKFLEFCENGAKATAWEITSKRCGPDFFAAHTLTELEKWSDHSLEKVGRLTEPMRYDQETDKYRPVKWEDAFAQIGKALRGFHPSSIVFYTSGRASLEASYMYQLFARMYGSNNLPDSSNMCHESTSVALPETIGVPVGTVKLEDFPHTDCMFFFGQNVGVNSPRMLHQLQAVRDRGAHIITFNPLRERGLERFTNPQSPAQMLTLSETTVSTQYHQLSPGGDLAAIVGLCKALIAADDDAKRAHQTERVIDVDFIREHTSGYEEFENARARFRMVQYRELCRSAAAGNRSRCSRLCAFKCSHSVLRHGLDTAQIRCARDSDAKQFPPNAGQYWQAGRRHFSCARPLECAGPAYRRNHREA